MYIYIKTSAIYLLLFIAELCFAEPQIIPQKENLPIFKMWLGAGLPEMQTYDEAVVELILNNSQEKYGNYHFATEIAVNTIKRQERIFRSSVAVAINVSPINAFYNNSALDGYLMMPHPIAKGMLGYRQLLVNKARVNEFRQIKTLQDLQQYSIAQVSGWTDIDILRSNGIKVNVIQKYELLFPMLNNKRFDSISVGCTETTSLLKFLEDHYPGKFELVPDLVLFYPLSLYIFVNVNHPEALERLSYGFDQAIKKGEINQLFDRYHSATFKKLNTPDLKVIQLKNSYSSGREAPIWPKLLQQYAL